MDVLGRNSIRVTLDIHTFVRLETQRSAIDCVGNALDDGRPGDDGCAGGVLAAV